MRKGWRTATIDEVCEVVNGGTPKTGIAANWGGTHMWITPAEMGRRSDPYVGETERRLTDAGLAAANLLPPHSVILSSRAPIGHLVINTVPMATNQGCKGLVTRPGLHHKYLFYYLGSIVGLLNDLGTGATFKELSGGKLKEVPIPLPPLTEQQRIVALLDEAFAGLATATANIKKNVRNARELFESYLNLVFAQPQGGWGKATLSDVCEKISDGTHQTPKYFENGFIFLSSKNVMTGVIDWTNVRYIDARQHDEMQKRVSPRVGDILLAKNGARAGSSAAIVDRDIPFDIYVSLALLRPRQGIYPKLLLHFINSRVAKKQFTKRLKGIGVPNLHLQEIRKVEIAYPKAASEQERMAAAIDELRADYIRLEMLQQRKLVAITVLKQSILQKAFSGELTSPPSQAIKEAAE